MRSVIPPKSAAVAENGETTATVAEFGDDTRTFLRQCGQALRSMTNEDRPTWEGAAAWAG